MLSAGLLPPNGVGAGLKGENGFGAEVSLGGCPNEEPLKPLKPPSVGRGSVGLTAPFISRVGLSSILSSWLSLISFLGGVTGRESEVDEGAPKANGLLETSLALLPIAPPNAKGEDVAGATEAVGCPNVNGEDLGGEAAAVVAGVEPKVNRELCAGAAFD